MATSQVTGLVSIPSSSPVDEVVERVKSILSAKKVKLFALIDHSGEAASAGLSIESTKLLIFGNPAGGTPLMQASPTAAIDLPLKLLIWRDNAGQVWVSYNSAEYLRDRHHLPEALLSNVAMIEGLAKQAAQ